MQYVVCYDIADDYRRNRISRALLDFGPRIQESVHWVTLDDDLAVKMRQRLEALMDPNFDRIHLFALCGACQQRVAVLGTGERAEVADFYVI